MASLRPISASRAATPLFWADSLDPVSTCEPNSTPCAGTAGGGPLYGGGGSVVVVSGGAAVEVSVEVAVGADVDVSGTAVVVSAPAGLVADPRTTSPASSTAAASATAPIRRHDRRRRTRARVGTIRDPPGRRAATAGP